MPDVQPTAPADSDAERDTLPTLDRVFLSEQLRNALAGGGERGSDPEDDDDDDERDTEPSVDTMLLRDALLAVGNNHGQ